ncbi:MAG: hypothetical protein J4478_04795 [Candidatus Diapherotrites archaeon]|uniref:IS1 family transposase n=2 Tax=Candidatus Iainarchaeum sp. TaxID=3101447 RepID=A0A7J4K300_9ARCH|nr:hypothetical protein [Candidatus Diapherotrites archaeon]HIH21866.1 hypothetical protein [Candidatus Diapherotrites archaeon]
MQKQELRKESFEKACPNCNSTELELYQGGIMGWQYKCRKCGWIGLPLEKKTLEGMK